MALWRRRVEDWYPDLYGRTHFLPPVFMHRTQHREEAVSGQRVLVTEPPTDQPRLTGVLPEKDVREDQGHQKVLSALQRLPETEPKFVISQLLFGKYLHEPSFAAATALLPRPGDPVLRSLKKDEGDFDVLIIDRRHGILAGEEKSVGDNFSELGLTPQKQDDILAKRVKQAIRQLKKSRVVLTHLVPTSPGQGRPVIRTTLMLPNISTAQLRRALTARQQLREVSSLLLHR